MSSDSKMLLKGVSESILPVFRVRIGLQHTKNEGKSWVRYRDVKMLIFSSELAIITAMA